MRTDMVQQRYSRAGRQFVPPQKISQNVKRSLCEIKESKILSEKNFTSIRHRHRYFRKTTLCWDFFCSEDALKRWECRFPFVWDLAPIRAHECCDSELSRYVDYINEDSQVSVSVAAGNEGAAQHHYTAELDYVKNQDTVELHIADKRRRIFHGIWGDPPDDYGYRYSHQQEKSCM